MSLQPPNLPPTEWVSEDIIRETFNSSQYYEQVKAGILTTYTKRNSQPTPPPPGEPTGTRSQIVYYYSPDNEFLAVVHQYMRPDGTIGGSGLPDPKRIYINGRILAVRSRPKKNPTNE